MNECEEPKCTRPATRNWNGRNVCSDHYESHQDELDRIRGEW